MALCAMCHRKLRLTRRIFAILLIIVLLIYIIIVSVFFMNVQTRDESVIHRTDAGVQQYTSKKSDTMQSPVNAFHPRWVRKPYSPNAVLKVGILGNYEPILDRNRTGPGEYGVPVPEEESEQKAIKKTSHQFGFNMVNSDKISLDRIVSDVRDTECKYWHYPDKLPTASVVIIFYNEGWSTFVRTVHSVINMSPPQLLHEVVLVDDCSDLEHLKSRLDEHMSQFGSKVKIVRNTGREGLIRSRTIGARAASGDVVVFLDAHCECSPNWLPPLLTRIAYDRTIMAAPIVDAIHWSDFTYKSLSPNQHTRGIFEWGFYYKETTVPEKELDKRQHKTEPYWSPTNAGGLFAINRDFFFELRAYDPHLEVWGGENFELAFKVWQCGGSSEWVPCSRVGHLYRHHSVSRKNNFRAKMSTTLINYVRVVEVWMDQEFKEYFTGAGPTPVVIQQISAKSFSSRRITTISSRHSNGTKCVEFGTPYKSKSALGTTSCEFAHTIFRLNIFGKIGVGERCAVAKDEKAITLEWCDTTELTGPWQWNETNGQLYNKDLHKCVSAEEGKITEFVECDDKAVNQRFNITEWYPWK